MIAIAKRNQPGINVPSACSGALNLGELLHMCFTQTNEQGNKWRLEVDGVAGSVGPCFQSGQGESSRGSQPREDANVDECAIVFVCANLMLSTSVSGVDDCMVGPLTMR
jgi:hypothetical protein